LVEVPRETRTGVLKGNDSRNRSVSTDGEFYTTSRRVLQWVTGIFRKESLGDGL
jgi:hypothetical protein